MDIKTIENSFSDYPGEIAYIIGLGGCNFRCGYCHNASLVVDHKSHTSIKENGALSFLEKKMKYVKHVVVSGGEPTIHKDLPGFLRRLKHAGLSVKLDTNGSNPRMLENIIKQGLVDYVAMDIKTMFAPVRYEVISGRKVDINDIRKSSELVRGAKDYMFRTTVVRDVHDEFVIEVIGESLKGSKRYQIQNFHGENGCLDSRFQKKKPFNMEELERLKHVAEDYFDEVLIRE